MLEWEGGQDDVVMEGEGEERDRSNVRTIRAQADRVSLERHHFKNDGTRDACTSDDRCGKSGNEGVGAGAIDEEAH